jgi:hypothetical protein
MIWHIFKKDCKLQWRFAALMAAIQFIAAIVVVKLSPLADSRPLRNLLQLLIMITLAGIPFLIGAAVHEDAIPGVRQDWLVRPIQRKDLLLAKFLFVLAAVHGPMLLADLFRGLAGGFPFGASLAAALSRGLFVLFLLSIPLLAFMSLTKNAMEAIAAALIVFLAFAASTLFERQSAEAFALGSGGLTWIMETALGLLGLTASVAILGLQYFRRRTFVSRVLAACAFIAATLMLALPWNPAFAVQQRMSPNPGAASAVAVSFDPTLGRFHAFTYSGEFHGNEEAAIVYLPLRFENLPVGSALISDHAELWGDMSGASTHAGFRTTIAPVRQETADQKPAAHLPVLIPANVFQQMKDQPGDFKIDLSLTLFRSDGAHTIPALNGNVHFPDLGTCVTKINAAETAVRLACAPLEDPPSCFRMYLQHVPTGHSNYPFFQCVGNYAPFFDSVFVTPPPQRNLVFRDLSGLAKYPVDGTMLNESQVVLETYQPIDHFTRTVSIPSIRLRDWTAQH